MPSGLPCQKGVGILFGLPVGGIGTPGPEKGAESTGRSPLGRTKDGRSDLPRRASVGFTMRRAGTDLAKHSRCQPVWGPRCVDLRRASHQGSSGFRGKGWSSAKVGLLLGPAHPHPQLWYSIISGSAGGIAVSVVALSFAFRLRLLESIGGYLKSLDSTVQPTKRLLQTLAFGHGHPGQADDHQPNTMSRRHHTARLGSMSKSA